jgi:hypothetical protein
MISTGGLSEIMSKLRGVGVDVIVKTDYDMQDNAFCREYNFNGSFIYKDILYFNEKDANDKVIMNVLDDIASAKYSITDFNVPIFLVDFVTKTSYDVKDDDKPNDFAIIFNPTFNLDLLRDRLLTGEVGPLV